MHRQRIKTRAIFVCFFAEYKAITRPLTADKTL